MLGDPVGWLDVFNPTGDPLTFSILSGNTGDAFAVDSMGDVTVNNALDYETLAFYSLQVEVSNVHGTDLATVDIT